MGIWNRFRIVYYLIKGILQPHNVKNALGLGDALRKSGALEKSVALVKESADGRKFFARKSQTRCDDLTLLETYPEGTLGKEYVQFLAKNGLDPRDLPPCPEDTEAGYLEHVVRQTHDVLHTLTGFDTSIAGELGLQAFMAKQFLWPFAMAAIGGGCLVTLFREPENTGMVIESIGRGWRLACQAEPLIVQDWNHHWQRPLDEVRAELGIKNLRS